MNRFDLMRYALWGAVALTANANRRYYHMTTTWLPHLLTNSLSLLLPDALRLIMPRRPQNDIEEVIDAMARDNDDYVAYVTPLAMGYILSHPSFNIYKGDLAEIRVAGFGLDAIPHSATALALTALVCDTLETADEADSANAVLRGLFRWGRDNQTLISFAVLAGLTTFWEYGEYRIHRKELAERGDVTQINMQWSAEDTQHDILSNLIGWTLATLVRKRKTPRAHAHVPPALDRLRAR